MAAFAIIGGVVAYKRHQETSEGGGYASYDPESPQKGLLNAAHNLCNDANLEDNPEARRSRMEMDRIREEEAIRNRALTDDTGRHSAM